MADRIEQSPSKKQGVQLMAWLACACTCTGWVMIQNPYAELGREVFIACFAFLAGMSCWIAHGRAHQRMWWTLAVGVALTACCGAVTWLGYQLEGRAQPQNLVVVWGARALLGMASVPAALSNGQILVNSSDGALTVRGTWGNTATVPLIASCTTLYACYAAFGTGRLGLAAAKIVSCGLLVWSMRLAILISLYVGMDGVLEKKGGGTPVEVFFSPWSGAVAVALLATISAAMLGKMPWRQAPSKGLVTALGVTFCSMFMLGIGVRWDPAWNVGRGRVLIDDRFSGIWEPAGRLLDTERYGDFSTYSMSALVEDLSRRYSVTVNASRPYDASYLGQFDVLIIKTPSEPIPEEETEAIDTWIRAGGGLFAIGDHTDLMGMNTRLNELCQPAGIVFRNDSTHHMGTGQFDVWKAPMVAEHVVSSPMADFQFMTGCSLALSGRAEPIMTVPETASEVGDYSAASNFGGRGPEPASAHGRLVLAAAAPLGSGRIIAFGDSTVLSSFAYYTWSHAEFVRRSVAWLNTSKGLAGALGPVLIGIGIFAFAILARRAIRREMTAFILFSAVAGLATGAGVATSLFGSALPVPTSDPDTKVLGIVADGGVVQLPPVLGNQPDDPDNANMMTLVQLPQRLGIETRLIPRDPSSLSDLDGLLIINPDWFVAPRSLPWEQEVLSWVEKGGSLMLLAQEAHADHEHDGTRAFIQNLELHSHSMPEVGVTVQSAQIGQGDIVRVIGSERLSVTSLGHCMRYPRPGQLPVYELIYSLLGDHLRLAPVDRSTYYPH